jgi:metal-responsive CopG/Arc/MetJ family transcriptional regulator
MAKITYSFSIDSKADKDLAKVLDSLPKRGRSEFIRNTLRAGLGNGRSSGVTLEMIFDEIVALREHGVVLGHDFGDEVPDFETGREDPNLAKSLKGLGEW